MNLNKIIVYVTFLLFFIDKQIDGDKTNYNLWIIIFLYLIAWILVNKNENK